MAKIKKGIFGSAFGTGPTIDASMGLIVRLNILWSDVDKKAVIGDLENWNYLLDRVYCNLSYREPMDIELDKETNTLKKLELAKIDKLVYESFNEKLRKIKSYKRKMIKEKNLPEYNKACQDHYNILLTKDLWLRKFMHELGLYMKEVDFNPATSLFGGGM